MLCIYYTNYSRSQATPGLSDNYPTPGLSRIVRLRRYAPDCSDSAGFLPDYLNDPRSRVAPQELVLRVDVE